MSFINQYSFVFAAVTLGALLAVILWRWQRAPASLFFRFGILALYVVAAVIVGLLLRYPPDEVATLAEAEARLDNDRPTFVMLYSNY